MVGELSTSRAFGPSGVKGDELAAVEFVPFDDLLALDHFADVAVDRPQGDPRRRPDVLRLFGDGYARCRLNCSGGTPRRCPSSPSIIGFGVTLAARHPHLMQPNRLRLGAGPSSSPRLPRLVKRPIGGGIGVDGETDHMLGDANDFLRDVGRIRWTAA
jgi:hypothetical protein